jgi:hypothetical protein
MHTSERASVQGRSVSKWNWDNWKTRAWTLPEKKFNQSCGEIGNFIVFCQQFLWFQFSICLLLSIQGQHHKVVIKVTHLQRHCVQTSLKKYFSVLIEFFFSKNAFRVYIVAHAA